LPLVWPNWLPCCLLWHLCLTSAGLPSPLPPPLVESCSRLPWLVVVLSPINLRLCDCHPPLPLPPVVGCCIFCMLHFLSSLLCGLSLRCAIATRSASLAPLVRLVIASPLLTPPPTICWHLCLSSHCCLLSHHGLLYLLSGWLLHHLYSCRRLPSAGVSASHCTAASCCAMASCTSCPAGCCVITTAHHLGVPLPLNMPPPPPISHLPFACPGWLPRCSLLCRLCHPSSCHATASQHAG
jgi:hypothetical protein